MITKEQDEQLQKRCISKCTNEKDKEIAQEVFYRMHSEFTHENDAGELYGTILFQVLYGLEEYKKAKNKYGFYISYGFYICLEFEKLNYALMNELLHYIHSFYPKAREIGIKRVATLRCLNYREKTEINVIFYTHEVFLYNFPEELKSKIEAVFEPIRDDLSICYTTTWNYSHLNCGDDYTYKENENPMIELSFPHESEKEIILNLLKQAFKGEDYEILS